jgi:hypothetical protein
MPSATRNLDLAVGSLLFALRRGSRQAFESIFKREGAPPPGLPKAFDYYTDF